MSTPRQVARGAGKLTSTKNKQRRRSRFSTSGRTAVRSSSSMPAVFRRLGPPEDPANRPAESARHIASSLYTGALAPVTEDALCLSYVTTWLV